MRGSHSKKASLSTRAKDTISKKVEEEKEVGEEEENEEEEDDEEGEKEYEATSSSESVINKYKLTKNKIFFLVSSLHPKKKVARTISAKIVQRSNATKTNSAVARTTPPRQR